MSTKQNKRKFLLISSIIVMISLVITGIVYASTSRSNPNHYVVDVVEKEATSSDNNLQITEKIVEESGGGYDSKELNYEVDLQNNSSGNSASQVAIVVDTSYSMGINDESGIAKKKAQEFADGILTTVKNSQVSVSTNQAVKYSMSNYQSGIDSAINALNNTELGDGTSGLDFAYNTLDHTRQDLNRYIVVFTDATDSVKDKMEQLIEEHPTENLNIISILIDATSTSYVDENNTPVCGEVYLFSSEDEARAEEESRIMQVLQQTLPISTLKSTGLQAPDFEKMYDQMNTLINEINVVNVFNDNISKYFEVSDLTATIGNVSETEENAGYTWDIEELRKEDTAKLTFKLKLKSDVEIDAGTIFDEIDTDKDQKITYNTLSGQRDFHGTDETTSKASQPLEEESEKTTVIKICNGYDLKLQAVNELSTNIAIEGITFQVEGIDEEGNTVCNITKTTGSDGFITITADEASALRKDGVVEFTVTPIVTVPGYTTTAPTSFKVKNNGVTRTLTNFDDNGNIFVISGSTPYDEGNRTVTLGIPIVTQKAEIEVQAEEINNSLIKLIGCDFRIKYPIDKHTWKEMTGTIDDKTSSVKFNIPVMTEDGEYEYLITQDSAPTEYNKLPATATIKVQFKGGKIVVGGATSETKNVTANADTDTHVLVTVQNECIATDPFDLTINLTDFDDGTPLEGVSYLIRIKDANNNVRNQYLTTNEEGKINATLYGSGYLTIEITEQGPKTGYTQDAVTKQININRNNNIIYVLNTNAGNGTFTVTQNTEKEDIVVNLTSKKKAEQNKVHVTLVDSIENDVAVGAGVVYTLIDEETNKTYKSLPSNLKGELDFTIDNKDVGDHKYKLVVDKTTIPSEYKASSVDPEIEFKLTFTNEKYILTTNGNGISITTTTQNIKESTTATVTGETSVEYTAFIKIMYEMDLSNTTEFKINLKDSDDKSTPIPGAKYDIDIEWEIGGVTKTKTITGRLTDAQGEISTRIVKGTTVTITVKETAAAVGYTKDLTTQEIVLHYNGLGNLIGKIEQTPYNPEDTENNTLGQGATEDASTKNIIFKHFNKKRSTDDTYLNLTVSKIDYNTHAYVGNVEMLIQGEETSTESTTNMLTGKDGKLLNLYTKTDENGTLAIDYEQFIQNSLTNDIIKVGGIGTTTESQYYYLNIYEVENDAQGHKVRKDSTHVRVRLVYVYDTDNGRVRLERAEVVRGNSLLVSKEITGMDNPSYTSASNSEEGQAQEDTYGVYLSNLSLNLWYNYEETGNLSIDLKKQNVNEDALIGAKYKVTVVNSNNIINKTGVQVKNGDADVELNGLTVNDGSTIQITEEEAPTGYAINQNTETLQVHILEDGSIELKHIDNSYNPERLKLKKLEDATTSDGKTKTNYEIMLTDYQLDTFEFGITAVDDKTGEAVDGYTYNIKTDKGAENNLVGNGIVKVGGNIEDDIITYTVKSTKTAEYYKPIEDKQIEVKVVFDSFGNVDVARTYAENQSSNKNWDIKLIETYGRIEIQIQVTHQDKLTVQVETLDKYTNAKLDDTEYKITPSVDLPGTGMTSIDVGYLLQDGLKAYTIDETKIRSSYNNIQRNNFSILYKDGKVESTSMILNPSDETTITKIDDKTVKITIKAEPKVPFEIENSYFFDKENTKLQGATFEVEEQDYLNKGIGITDSKGIADVYTGKFEKNTDKLYKVSQKTAEAGYATVEDFYVKVTYDGENKITDAKLVDKTGAEVAENENKFVTVTKEDTTNQSQKYNGNDLGAVKITVLNYPELQIEITDLDRTNEITPLAGTTYSVTSKYQDTANGGQDVNFTSTNGVVTDAQGKGVAHLDKTKKDTVVTYTVKEDVPAATYQSFGEDIEIKVTYDENGYISKAECINITNDKKAKVSITDPSSIQSSGDPKEHFKINLQLENNPLLEFHITARDSKDETVKIKDIGFQMVSEIVEENKIYSNSAAIDRVNQTDTPETSYTNTDGETILYLDRTVETKTMVYTLKEVQKSPGYEWADEEIQVQVVYDANGKIQSASIIKGEELVQYQQETWLDAENFTITFDVLNEEIKEFGIHLTAQDTYNSEKKLSYMKVEAFLTDGSTSYVSDGVHELVRDNALYTGEDKDQDGMPDITYGEDYKTMGQHTGEAKTEILRLVIKNDSRRDHYLTTYDGSYEGADVGYYKSSIYHSNARYQAVKYQYLIQVDFTDEGKIANAKLLTGHNDNIGWLADNRYIEVDNNGNLSHTDYKLNITMKFFPMLKLSIGAIDNYTKQTIYPKPTEDYDHDPKEAARFLISTDDHARTSRNRIEEYVTAGYIGYGHYYSQNQTVYGDIYEDINVLYVPIEPSGEREFYVFEEREPENYQTTNPRDLRYYDERMVAIVNIVYDQDGNIDWDHSINRYKKDPNNPGEYLLNQDGDLQGFVPWQDRSGSNYLSSSNVPEYATEFTKDDQTTKFDIGYALTTSISVTAVDDISGDPITGIAFKPFLGGTDVTNKHYEYLGETRTFQSDSDGNSSWKYWGAAVNDSENIYKINSLGTTGLNGYFFPADLADQTIGGSGKAEDYYAQVKVTYGSNGKISNVESIGSDLWGDDNIREDITWDSKTGKIHINLIFSRKFQFTLNKVDFYDNTKNNLLATFDITSTEGLNATVIAKQMQSIGKVYKNKNVKYTLSEENIPLGYYPIEDKIDFVVEFDENGNISKRSVKSNSEWFDNDSITTSQTTKVNHKTKPDLEVNIKNKPALLLELRAIDKFYKQDGIEGIKFNITSDKNDKATGSPQTNANGYAVAIAGPIYPGETVTYSISQENYAPDYYKNETTVKLQVTYNDKGTIQNYSIIEGDEVVYNFNSTAFLNQKVISMQIMNMPESLKIGLYKFDQTTKDPIDNVQFEITKADATTGEIIQNDEEEEKVITTQKDGNVIARIDTFEESPKVRAVKYTIHEVDEPKSFRKMEDIVFVVTYNQDGSINNVNQIPNENGILNTNVSLKIAIGTINHLDGQRVHFLVNVPNDNAFDLIIKDEDKNYQGLGIEGTQYDLSINGATKQLNPTDANGQTSLNNIIDPKSGEITLSIAEREIGEGYRENQNNKIEIQLNKGSEEYSLKLKESTEGFVDEHNAKETTKDITVKVDEEHGVITVTFKNETKTEITVVKQDKYEKTLLEGAAFKVEKQQWDTSTDTAKGELILIKDPIRTDTKGESYLDLGVAPQSETWKYTFTEKVAPNGYNKIVPVVMTVTYDQYGRIQNIQTDNKNRLIPAMATDNYNCHSIYAIINNGDISPAYTVKVVTEDDETGMRINGSKIDLEVTDENGTLLQVEPKTKTSMANGSSSVTANLGLDGKWYTDADLLAEQNKGKVIVEKGLVYLDNIDKEGNIIIKVTETECANGYIFGDNNTDGTIKIKTEYEPQPNDKDPVLKLTPIDVDNMDVNLDEANQEIIITIKNTSQVLYDITTEVYGDPESKIQGASYKITATEETVTDSIELPEVNVTTPASDINGKTTGNVGKAYAGKTIKYTIEQTIPSSYQPIQNIEIEVTYDGRGYIKYIEPLTSMENISIDEEKTLGGRIIYLTVYNHKDIGEYKVSLEKHTTDTVDSPDAYDILVPGATYEITVTQEYGSQPTYTWVDTTNQEGYIPSITTFDGYGRITIHLKELSAPEGYKLDTEREITLYRNKETGVFSSEGTTSNVNYAVNADNTEICAKPVDQQLDGKYTFAINKYSSRTSKLITEGQAKFKAELIKQDEEGNITYQETIEDLYTVNGKVILANQDMPTEEGEYTLKITEEEAPEGFIVLEDPVSMKVTFVKDVEGNMYIDSVRMDSEDGKMSIVKVDKQTIRINVENDVDMQLEEDEYLLDISKVDAETNTEIREMALFKVELPDIKNTSVYVETINDTPLGDGKLDYCFIEENKDYNVRLTHMNIPTIEEIQAQEEKAIVHKYEFKEVTAPKGYEKIEEPLELEVEFKVDEQTNEVYISRLTSSNEIYLKINTQAPCSTKTYIDVDILNNEENTGGEEKDEYQVHYEANTQDQVTLPKDQVKKAGEPLQLDQTKPTRTGYEFKEWNTQPDGQGQSYNPSDMYDEDKDLTLFAIWEESGKLYLRIPEYSQYEIGENNAKEYTQGDEYISNLIPEFDLDRKGQTKQRGTTVEEFKKNIDTNATTIVIEDKDGNELTDTDLVGTGAKLHLEKDSEQIDIYLSVIGDLSGDGKILADDQAELLQAYQKTRKNKNNPKQYFIDRYPTAKVNIDPDVMYKSADLTDDNIGQQSDDISIMTIIRGYKTQTNTSSGIKTLKLWRK